MPDLGSEALDLVEAAIVFLDADSNVELTNGRAHNLFGLTRGASNLSEAVGPECVRTWEAVQRRAQAEGSFRTTVDGPLGKSVQVYAARRAKGGVMFALRFPEHRAEISTWLHAYAEVLGHHGVGLWHLDVPSGELWWSPKCYELLGIPEEPVSTESYLEHLSPEARAIIAEHMAAANSGAGPYAPEFKISRPDGSGRVQDRCHVLEKSRSGAAKLVVGATLDRTRIAALEERCEQLEQRLLQAEHMQDAGRLAGAIAHDLNNVMTVVVGNAELLTDDLAAGSDEADLVQDILTASKHASALASRMLDFVRETPLQLEAVELGQFVEDALPFLGSMIADTVDLSHRVRARPAWIMGDRPRLEQVLYNLVLNAAAAAGETGSIAVEVDVSKTAASLAVIDDGPGIAPDSVGKVFEAFFTTRVGGAGLGLVSVKKVIEQHGGNITCTSEVGIGTRFTATLPRLAPGIRLGPQAPLPLQKASPAASVWVVDDQRLIRIVAERILRAAGYRVRTFPEPVALLSTMSEEAGPELVLIDVIMPQMTGPELARRIRRRSERTRTMLMSGYTDTILQSHLDGLDEIPLLRKPFTRTQLLRAIEDTLSARISQRG